MSYSVTSVCVTGTFVAPLAANVAEKTLDGDTTTVDGPKGKAPIDFIEEESEEHRLK